MRFLLLTQYFLPEVGASQVRLAAVVRRLKAEGHEVEVVTAMPNHPVGTIFPEYRGRFYQKDTWEGVTVHRVWVYASMGAGLKRIVNYLSFMVLCMFGILRCKKPDFLFVESPPLFTSIPAWIASRWWRVPFIFNVADLWPDSVKRLGVMKDGWMLRLAEHLEHWSYRKATYVNAVTQGIHEELIQTKGLPESKVLNLFNGVDLELYQPAAEAPGLRAELGLPEGPVLLYAGTHGYAHGMEVALEAAALLTQEKVQFLFVGDGSEKPKLLARAKEMGLTNVHFHDPVPPERMSAFYGLSIAGLSTLRNNPLFVMTRPVKILGNMACAKPVVYVGEGEGAKLVQEAGSGPVVPPENPQALAQAVRDLLKNPEAQSRYGAAGRAYVEANMSWDAMVKTWLKSLEEAHV
jgi:colanic acid biosynthesis glycosyl transferase WcaI